MTLEQQVDYMLADCFLAAGQGVGHRALLGFDAITWWRDRYREKFGRAIAAPENCWNEDRERLLGVSRFLGARAVDHAGVTCRIDCSSAARASDDIEAGCKLRAQPQPVPLRPNSPARVPIWRPER